jgi:hypothetical protein
VRRLGAALLGLAWLVLPVSVALSFYLCVLGCALLV